MAAASSFTFAAAASAFAVATSAFTASAAATAATTMVTVAPAASVGMYKFTVQTFRKLFFSRFADADYLPGEM